MHNEPHFDRTLQRDGYYQSRNDANRSSNNKNWSTPNGVAEVVPARVAEIVPVRVTFPVAEIVPVRVAEIVPALVAEMVPVLANVVVNRAEINNAAQTTALRFFISSLLVIRKSGVMGRLGGSPLSLSSGRLLTNI